MSKQNGNIVNGYWYGFIEYVTNTTDTAVTVTVSKVAFHCVKDNYKASNVSATLKGTTTYSVSGKTAGGSSGSDYSLITGKTFTFPRGDSTQTKTVSFSVTTSGGKIAPGTSKGSISVSVPEAYTAPSVECKAYRVSASVPTSKYEPAVDPTGTRGYYEIKVSGGNNWVFASGHTLTIGGISCSIVRNGTTDIFYGYTPAGAVPEGNKVTATASIKLTAMGTTKSVTGTTYIAPISHMIDIAPNCVAIGKSASDNCTKMTFEVGCSMLLNGAELVGEDIGAWSVVKLPGGFKLACAKITFSSVAFSAAGNLYRSDEKTVNIPTGIFTGAPHVIGETAGSSTLLSTSFDAASATQIKGYLFKLNNNTSDHSVKLYCFGK